MEELTKKLNTAKVAESNGNFFNAAFLYKEVLELARNSGQSEIIKICKNKIPEINKQIKNDLNKFSIEYKVPEKNINKVIKYFLSKNNFNLILKTIGVEQILFPNYQEVVKLAQATMPISFNIANLSTISEDGNLIKGGDNGIRSWEMTLYEQHQTIILRTYLTGLFYELIDKNIVNKKILSNYLKNTGFSFTKSYLCPLLGYSLQKDKLYFQALGLLDIKHPEGYDPNSWYKVQLLYSLSDHLDMGVVSERLYGTGIVSEYNLGSTKFKFMYGKEMEFNKDVYQFSVMLKM